MIPNKVESQINKSSNQIAKLNESRSLQKDMDLQIQVLKNRLNLLDNEESKNQSIIQTRKSAIRKIIDIKELKDNHAYLVFQQMIEKIIQITINLSTRQYKDQGLDNQRKLKYQIQNKDNQLENKYFNKAKLMMKRLNLKKNTSLKNNKIMQNLKMENQYLINVNEYWNQKLKSFEQDRLRRTNKFVKSNIKQQKQIDNLLYIEQQKLQKLQISQENLIKYDQLLSDKSLLYQKIDTIDKSFKTGKKKKKNKTIDKVLF